MSDLKESIFLMIVLLITGALVGFYFGEKSMCERFNGKYDTDFGKCEQRNMK